MEQLDVNSIKEQLMKSCIINGAIMPLDEIEHMGINEFGIRSKLNMPSKLYKYYSNIDEKNSDGIIVNYSQQSLINNTVYLQTPTKFDDIYDSDITLDYNAYERLRVMEYCKRCGVEVNDEWTNQEAGDVLVKSLWPFYIQKNLEKAFTVAPKNELERLSNQEFIMSVLVECKSSGNFGEAVSRAIANEYQKYSEYLKEVFRITCFTTTPYSQLMWGGSYADQHRGFCVEYTVLPQEKAYQDIYYNIFPVVYCKVRPDVTKRIVDAKGIISFDVIVSCDMEMSSTSKKGYFGERWLKIHCQVALGIDMSGFRIIGIGNCDPQEESDNDRLSGELVPIISREQFEKEAERFLERYCPEALEKPICLPIDQIAEDMKLKVVEDTPLSDELTYFGTVVFDDGNILDKHRKITIRNAKRGTVYLDPRASYERSIGTRRTTLAHESFHWHRHQPYHVLMKMIGADDNLGKAIQCQIATGTTDSDKWKAVDWMEWQAKGVAPKILMPEKTVRPFVDRLLVEYSCNDRVSVASFERVIDALAETYDVSRQAAKVRLVELGYTKAEGAYPYVNGKYVSGYSFDADALEKDQTFTIPYADLLKAYCYDRDFRKLIDEEKFRYIDGHVCLNEEKFIVRDDNGMASLSSYAVNHIDECCLVFTRGYSYQSKYQGLKNYAFFMRNSAPQEDQIEFSFELNKHNKTLLAQIQNAGKCASALQRYPGSFSETLVQLMKDKKLSAKKLADGSLVGEKTIQRLRNNEEYPTTKQTVLGLCYGLKLTIPEAEMLLGKAEFSLKSTTPENNAYRCTLGSCAELSIYEVNEMLVANGYLPFGSSPAE